MSTPAGEGYLDPATGQFIPGSFAQQLNLPGPTPIDQISLARNQAKLAEQKAIGAASKTSASRASSELKTLQGRLKQKGLSAKAKASINRQISLKQTQLKAASATQTRAATQQATLQNQIYTATGQFEKLLTGKDRDAYASLQALFNGYGLGSLAGKIYEYAKQGYGADTISLLLQNTKEYKDRFAGNQERLQKGLPVLSPAEYLSTEQAYRQILQDSGLPKGFYDNPADFQKWIGGDVSPTEIKGRVDLAVGNTLQASEQTKQALQQLYGIDQSHLTAYFLDDKAALPLLQKQAQAAQYGAQALAHGLGLNKGNLEDFVTAGLSLGQVASGFQAVAEALPNIQAIAARYGETFSQNELERDLIGGGTVSETGQQITAKRKRLASQERGLFSGFGGGTPAGLSPGFQAT